MKHLCYPIVLSVVVFFACQSRSIPTDVNEKSTTPTLIDQTWDVTSFGIVDSRSTDLGSVGIFIEFHEDSTFSGGSYQKENGPLAYNSFKGIYSNSSDSIFIKIMYMTEINEPEGSRLLEFVGAVNGDIAYEINNDILILLYNNTKTINLSQRVGQ